MTHELTEDEIHALWVQHVGTHTSHTGFARAVEAKVLAHLAQRGPSWPDGLLDRVKAAEERIANNDAPRRIPADVRDVDLVLAEVRYLIEGKWPPFWLAASPQAVQPMPDGVLASGNDQQENGLG